MTIACPLCNATGHSIKYGMIPGCPGSSIVQCNDCRHYYTFKENNTDEIKIYNDEVYAVVENRSSVFDKILSFEYNRVLRRMNKYQPAKGSLLDFGAGKGKFGSLAVRKGWNVKGVETAPARADYARKNYGLEISSDYYSAGKIFGGNFNAITFFHVLEHLPGPASLLGELVRENLSRGGIVVIEVPNFNSWQRKIAGKRWMHFDAERHVSHFTKEKIIAIVRPCGLSLKRSRSFSFHLGVLGMTDSLLKLFGYRKNIILELKQRKSKWLMARIILLVPFALAIEAMAAIAGGGGITRNYFYLTE